jgi:hypothetical protein
MLFGSFFHQVRYGGTSTALAFLCPFCGCTQLLLQTRHLGRVLAPLTTQNRQLHVVKRFQPRDDVRMLDSGEPQLLVLCPQLTHLLCLAHFHVRQPHTMLARLTEHR